MRCLAQAALSVVVASCVPGCLNGGTPTPSDGTDTNPTGSSGGSTDSDPSGGATDTSSGTASGTGGGETVGSTGPGTDTAATTGDPTNTTGDPPGCTDLPSLEPSWLAAYQDEIVARLSGERELVPGTTVSDRSGSSSRTATREFLRQAFTDQGLTPQTHDYSSSGANVYADLAPDSPNASDELVVVGAHFDTVPRSPGANDNATGVAAVLATARYLAEVPCRTRGVIFVLFDEEEDGLVGSDAFAGWLDSQGVSLHSAHTIDQMGWDEDGDRNIELERPSSGLYERYESVAEAQGYPGNLIETRTQSSDHRSFRDWGFPAVGITEEFASGDSTPYIHRPTDTYDTVDFVYLASTTVFLNAVFTELVQE